MNAALTSSNRVNIPCVCRLCDAASGTTAGSGVLVGPGLLLSSTLVLGEDRGACLKAVFFEGTKKRPVEVRLLPERYYFAASYPAYMDYCLVACEEGPLRNVQPVQVPLTRRRWPHVDEGDILLIVQHPIQPGTRTVTAASVDGDGEISNATASVRAEGGDGGGVEDDAQHEQRPAALVVPVGPEREVWMMNGGVDEARVGRALEMKCFEEVLRRRGDLFYLRASGNLHTAGCPAFNDAGQLVGLQCQTRADGEGVVNRVLSIVAIVQHLFANNQLCHLPQTAATEPRPEDVWETWFVAKDVSRVVAILANFEGEANVRAVTRKLCELADDAQGVESVASCGGIDILLTQLLRFRGERDLAYLCMRALWKLSAGRPDHLLAIATDGKGPLVLLTVLELYADEEELLQLGVVLLSNLATANCLPVTLVGRTLEVTYAGMLRFRGAPVLQKFGMHLLRVLVLLDPVTAPELVRRGVLGQLCLLLTTHGDQIFLIEALMCFVGELVQHEAAVQAACTALNTDRVVLQLIELLVDTMLQHAHDDTVLLQGNRALWALGSQPACRVALLQNPKTHKALQLSLPALVASLDLP